MSRRVILAGIGICECSVMIHKFLETSLVHRNTQDQEQRMLCFALRLTRFYNYSNIFLLQLLGHLRSEKKLYFLFVMFDPWNFCVLITTIVWVALDLSGCGTSKKPDKFSVAHPLMENYRFIPHSAISIVTDHTF